MDVSSNPWLTQLGIMETIEYDIQVSYSPESLSSCTEDNLLGKNGVIMVGGYNLGFERPTKLAKTSSWGSTTIMTTTTNSSPPQMMDGYEPSKLGYGVEIKQWHNNSNRRGRSIGLESKSNPCSVSQDHLLAERKRREKLSQRLIALSALIPGLTKMDKASVLGEAIKYLKNLQEQIQSLKEKLKHQKIESAVLVSKSRFSIVVVDDDDGTAEDANSWSCHPENSTKEAMLPEVEARVMNKDVLIRIHCERHRDLLVNILSVMANDLHLSVVATSSMAFGDYDLVITLTAQMKEDEISAKDIMSKLRKVFQQCIDH